MPGRRTILILGALLGSLFLYLAVRKVDWPTLIATLSHAHPGYVGLGLLSMLAFFGVKAWRWRYLIHPFAQATTRELLPPVLAGLAGNYVFPHVGEVARAVLASQRVKAPVSALLVFRRNRAYLRFPGDPRNRARGARAGRAHVGGDPGSELCRRSTMRRDIGGSRVVLVPDRGLPPVRGTTALPRLGAPEHGRADAASRRERRPRRNRATAAFRPDLPALGPAMDAYRRGDDLQPQGRARPGDARGRRICHALERHRAHVARRAGPRRYRAARLRHRPHAFWRDARGRFRGFGDLQLPGRRAERDPRLFRIAARRG